MAGVDMSTMSGFFELNNGCICCTVKDDLVTTLEQLALHKDNFDYILIEATGTPADAKIRTLKFPEFHSDSISSTYHIIISLIRRR
jgi:G3E family GTPase